MKCVSIDEFVDRMINLAKKYSDYKCRFDVLYDETQMRELLKKSNIKYEIWCGNTIYDEYGSMRSQIVILNNDKQDRIVFNRWLANRQQPFEDSTGVPAKEILEYLINYSETSSMFRRSNDVLEILIKDIISTVYLDYKPIIVLIEQPSKKRSYEKIKINDDKEIVIQEITITEKCTKKIKI